ncbi:MAG: flagellar hook assembly protein FlgD [Sulfuriflexus sp.]|nr:flagellar hook assembly protein FlgD [Sulfuriflexus sp.]
MPTINTDTLQNLGIATNKTNATKAAEGSNELGQQQFLELMVAQIRNQDPFEPLENGEFLSQIAQFSTVSGIQDLQDSFSSFAGSISSNQALQASALVGRTVAVNSDIGVLKPGGKVDGALGLPSDSNLVKVEFFNTAGELVREIPLGAQKGGLVNFSWDGLTDSGQAAPAGAYRIVATANIDGEDVALGTLVKDNVESVILGRPGEGTVLNLSALGATDFNRVEEIR